MQTAEDNMDIVDKSRVRPGSPIRRKVKEEPEVKSRSKKELAKEEESKIEIKPEVKIEKKEEERKEKKEEEEKKIPNDFNFTKDLSNDIKSQIDKIVADAVNARILQLAKVLNLDVEKLRQMMELPVLSTPVPKVTRGSPKKVPLPDAFKTIPDNRVIIVTDYKSKHKPNSASKCVVVFGMGATKRCKAKLEALAFNYCTGLTFGTGEAPGYCGPRDKLAELEKMFKKVGVKVVKATQAKLATLEESDEEDSDDEIDLISDDSEEDDE